MPAGPTDPEITLLSVQTPEGKPVALLANYSLHYVGGLPPLLGSGDAGGSRFRLSLDAVRKPR